MQPVRLHACSTYTSLRATYDGTRKAGRSFTVPRATRLEKEKKERAKVVR